MNIKREWTVLVYANGNNELEPEICRSKTNAQKVGSNGNVSVIMQIGRIPKSQVEFIRPKTSLSCEEGIWTGVRSYKIGKNTSTLICDLGNINMADPRVLHEFIIWGFTNYPSKRRMLIVGGHGFSFVAVMTDFSQDLPYMMGVPQMCRAINSAMRYLEKNLDVLALDACCMNSIEIVYELCGKRENPIKYLLTYIKGGPLEGLPLDKMVSTLKCSHSNTVTLLKDMVDDMDLDVVVIEMNHRKLKNIKRIVNRLARTYLRWGKNIDPKHIIYTQDKNCPWYGDAVKYNKSVEKIITCYKTSSPTCDKTVDILHKSFRFDKGKMDYIALIYLNLSFCRNNCWVNILTDKSLEKIVHPRFRALRLPLEPMVMHPKTIGKIIMYMNAPYSEQEIKISMHKLFSYKKWDDKVIINTIEDKLNDLLSGA